jgi:putative transposase
MTVIHRHQPLHLYLDNQIYFLTAHTYSDQSFLASGQLRQKLLDKIKNIFSMFRFDLYAWVVLINHYHLLCKIKQSRDIPKCIGKIHGGFSYDLNKAENRTGRKIWQNYWDRCIRSEKDFWVHLNYIHHNPVKHGHAQKMEEYAFSSYGYWLKKNGSDWMASVFQQYPIIDFSISND